jgi:prephenate dehydratase
MRVAYLGPAGTFTEDALRAAGGGGEPVLTTTVSEAIEAVRDGRADRALVPFENSIEGSVRPTLDTLARLAGQVTIVGEHDHRVRINLIAREQIELDEIREVISHSQPLAQCAEFLRTELAGAATRAVESTAEAVRLVSEGEDPVAALGARSAAELYGCTVLREGIEDEGGNVTRFVWVAPAGTKAEGAGPWKTSLIFSELGEDHPGALVSALREFSSREVNLIRIESRPLRNELGRYMFFVDLEGSLGDEDVAAAVEGLRIQAESVDILGSYPVAGSVAE